MKKSEIIEFYARSYQADRHPPIAGKIIGLFTVSKKRYLSFEQIQSELGISKSALSKNLNLLIEINRVCFVPDPNSKRKRLFGLDIDGINRHLQSIIENFKLQRDLSIHAKDLRAGGDKVVEEFIETSINFSTEMIEQLEIITNKYFTK